MPSIPSSEPSWDPPRQRAGQAAARQQRHSEQQRDRRYDRDRIDWLGFVEILSRFTSYFSL
jgi:hypothetical protein